MFERKTCAKINVKVVIKINRINVTIDCRNYKPVLNKRMYLQCVLNSVQVIHFECFFSIRVTAGKCSTPILPCGGAAVQRTSADLALQSEALNLVVRQDAPQLNTKVCYL